MVLDRLIVWWFKMIRKIINKRAGLNYLAIVLLVVSLFSVPIINAQAQNVKFCCEKTTYGAWCQNVENEEYCDSGYRKTPTSCEATSYCRLGTCYDSSEGICMENTPQRVCDNAGGTWDGNEVEDVPQCQLGCCVLGTQAAFVTLTRCKKLSSFYGLITDFRRDIGDELSCISLASLSDEGACVYEIDFAKTCKFTTRQECNSIREGMKIGNETETVTGKVEFHKDFLCSAEELGTNCGLTKETTCVEGKDEVYFVDSCGNPANIYDASKVNDKAYWRKVVKKEESCGAGTANINSKSCGNCDYLGGSICSVYKRAGTRPKYGEYICRDLNCKDTSDGPKKHGESWCAYDNKVGNGRDVVGSRHIRHICLNGEEIIEPCADFRQEVCIEDEINGFSQAGCIVNRWQDCITQTKKEDCENLDRRECVWLPEGLLGARQQGRDEALQAAGQSFTPKSSPLEKEETTTSPITGASIFGGEDKEEERQTSELVKGACVPSYPPGFDFWQEGESQGICSQASVTCIVEFEKKGFLLSEKEKCVKNCECLSEEWAARQNRVCASLGDCGAYVNIEGKFTEGGYEWKKEDVKENFGRGLLESIWEGVSDVF